MMCNVCAELQAQLERQREAMDADAVDLADSVSGYRNRVAALESHLMEIREMVDEWGTWDEVMAALHRLSQSNDTGAQP